MVLYVLGGMIQESSAADKKAAGTDRPRTLEKRNSRQHLVKLYWFINIIFPSAVRTARIVGS